ncbi:MAG: hypothetical protein KKE02_15195 [Alphaproteobacteria bacterium]|nr:hypothetical protein [Alphaproteobacteria bacterium]MBU1516810.1 hypothetical protein [Alphaproteobacteria bacterium]MBU2092504.1 hypothetical protein [Alphaproteobacteria bacterium]MBU2152365.1 hypothetical protein [Alphaproteobacteria bacterium]MBU2305576.1 hypothetical protein [Alphaproteobacteria bacterium]
MRLIPTLAFLMFAGAAGAQPIAENPPTKTIQCIDVGGQQVPALCRVPASRLDPREDICTCPGGGQRVEVAVCAKGQTPPPEGRALNIARRTAIRDGSLLGDMIGDKPICVAPRNR